MNKKQVIIIAIVVTLLIATTGIALAGGVKNTTYIKFFGGGWKDSYWKTTGSGLVHEWRTTDNKHFVFKPVGKFSAPDCDPDKLISAFKWTSHSYPHDMDVSEGTIDDFVPYGDQFYVCMYHWK